MRVEASGIGKRFGRVTALSDVCFELPAGQRTALVGPNGSGKSTLNRILMGLLSYDGELRLDGLAPSRERVEIARRMAYVPQTAPGMGAPLGDLVRELSRVRGLDPARVAGIASELDLELADFARRPFRALSGGTKQKVLIALALAAKPSLLILDEPTGSLDARARERFLALCDRLPKPTTLLLCSHHFEEVRQLVDHVLVLDEGRVVYDGAATAFLDGSTTGVIEVRVEGQRAAAWLQDHGFRPGAGGWWTRAAGRTEKSELLVKLTNELGSSLRDLSARDLERIELEPERGGRDGRD